MVKHISCSLVVIMGMMETPIYGQSLFSPRAIGLGAYAPVVNDTRSFTDNPAGIVHMRDWELNISTYMSDVHSSQGFTFEGVSLGKRFLDNFAVALQYSPGTTMEFAIPTALVLTGPTPTSVDQSISYDEPLAAGCAWKPFGALSLGIDARYRNEKITDTQYQLAQQDTAFSIERLPDLEYNIRTWSYDLGLQWKPLEALSFSLVGGNLLQSVSGSFPEQLDQYRVTNGRDATLGAAWTPANSLLLCAEYGSYHSGAFGVEWSPGLDVSLRSGIYANARETPFVSGVGVGAGWSYGVLNADISYIGFTTQGNRQGTSALLDFEPTAFRSIDLNRYSSDRVQLSLKAIFGAIRPGLAVIETVEMTDVIYPAAVEALAYRPVGRVRVRNISNKPIEARARFFVEKYMDDPTESRSVHILPGEAQDIPITAVFNDRVRDVERMIIREGNVYVSATPSEDYDDKCATPVLIHGRNDWDGSVYSLRYFVTPDDPAVIRFTRDILLSYKDSLRSEQADLEAFRKAGVLFEAFSRELVYVNDPRETADFVQYPAETLQIHGGDCDDMTTCFSSLLNSVGVSTAFVDVVPPEDSSRSHIYLMFDTGLAPKYGNAVTMNSKRYIIRKNQKGTETIWIPVETTAITLGFDAAWAQGAQEYYDDVEVGLGLIKGWVKIVDVY